MKPFLNDFMLELMKTAPKETVDIKLLQQRFDVWKEDQLQQQNEVLKKKETYLQKHHLPRIERENAVQAYLEEYTRLRDAFLASTAITRKATLRKWLEHTATLPPMVLQTPSTLYTMYPYEENGFSSVPNIDKA